MKNTKDIPKISLIQKECKLIKFDNFRGMALKSYPFITGEETLPPLLDADWLLGQFNSQRSKALKSYRPFVMAGS